MQKIKSIFILSCFVFITNITSAQIFSPYSQYGLGILHSSQSSVSSAMGGISAAYSDPYNINYTNPAALADTRLTALDIGLRINGRSINSEDNVISVADGGVNNISLSFPVMKNRWGMSFGLLPYSFTKYKYSSNNNINGLAFKSELEGKGSLYKLYFANGVKYKGFKLGINTELIFGKLENSLYNEFDDKSNIGSKLTKSINVRDVIFNVGAQYNFILTKFEDREKGKQNLEMTVGAYFAPSLKVDAFSSNYLEAIKVSSFTGNPYPIDTAEGAFYNKYTTISVPMNTGLGFSIGKRDKWNFGMDYDFKSWVKVNNPINPAGIADQYRIKIGGSMIPDSKSPKFLNKVTYRFGSYFGKAPIIHENTDVSDFGITFGFGLPFARRKYTTHSYSNLNLAFEIGALGINNNQKLVENYYNMTLTYTLSDLWFRKQKFN